MSPDDLLALVTRLAPRGWRCRARPPGVAWDVCVEARVPPPRRGRDVRMRRDAGLLPDTAERGVVVLRVRGLYAEAEVEMGGPRWIDAAADRWEERVFQALAGSQS